jgi:hypothetical protein
VLDARPSQPEYSSSEADRVFLIGWVAVKNPQMLVSPTTEEDLPPRIPLSLWSCSAVDKRCHISPDFLFLLFLTVVYPSVFLSKIPHHLYPHKMDSLAVPRKLWEHPNPKGTQMYKLMQEINQKQSLQLKVHIPSNLLPSPLTVIEDILGTLPILHNPPRRILGPILPLRRPDLQRIIHNRRRRVCTH